RSTAREASKQARRLWFAEVEPMVTTPGVITLMPRCEMTIVLHEDARATFASLPPTAGSVLVVVGPEGGLSDDEVASFEAAGAHAVRLGFEVLRTSTAGVAAVAALLSRSERWGG
ncbi:MAG: RsmE family RNA methyltransferase, partial [Nocardioides sp.]